MSIFLVCSLLVCVSSALILSLLVVKPSYLASPFTRDDNVFLRRVRLAGGLDLSCLITVITVQVMRDVFGFVIPVGLYAVAALVSLTAIWCLLSAAIRARMLRRQANGGK